ncbi:tigger transposable element-derived protein [Elysia marginata]|uniref:Tigger transposable element-derived protein n=1 Tax=Elysia marginata TaxID=1093978 RepID=A0AAV4EW45_9GAST|nr:tigger transposable element-derived protein [Elysia marginata]
MLPDKTLALKDETCTGGKKLKSQLVVMPATNMDGSDKLPALVIGKSKNPHAFKHAKTLPVCYRSNKIAWMTSALFEEWLKKLDRQMVTQKRKIAMVKGNCPAHRKVEDLKAIELIFLPPNTTSILQPCDQGIINYGNLFSRLNDLIPLSATAQAYLTIDEDLAASEVLTTEDIVNSVVEKDVDNEEEGEEDEEEMPPPTLTDARDAIKTLRLFIQSHSNAEDEFTQIANLQVYIEKVFVTKCPQTWITNFFKKM